MSDVIDEVDVLLIGGGTAATAAAVELRAQGFDGSVTVLTRELEAPYHRPAVSKELLGTDGDQHPVALLPPQWWDEHNVALRTRAAAASLDTGSHIVSLADKSQIRYGKALLATGANVRRLQIPGTALSGVHYLRAPANSAKLRADLADARDAVLVGGSFIATEVAAALTERGVRCTMIMPEPAPLHTALGPTVAEHVARRLTERGVRLVCGDQVEEIVGDGRVQGVRTRSGHQERADVVVVGVGAVPDTRLAARAGLELGETGGIATDSTLRTSAPDVYAAGDVCEYDSAVHGRRLRVEHDRHAAEQGVTAAHGLLGAPRPHAAIPYFWTDISNWLCLQYVGPAEKWDHERIEGSLDDDDFTVWYESGGRVVAALTTGRPHDLDRTRQVLRLRQALLEYFPAALDAFDDFTRADTIELLGTAPDPDTAARLTHAQIGAAMRRARRRGIDAKAATVAAALRRPGLTRSEPVTAGFAAATRSLTTVIAALSGEIATLERALGAEFERHPAAAIYRSQPGLGPVVAARVLAEFGDDPGRYASARSRKNYAATSPITRQSGKRKSVHARYVHNERLVDALGRQAQGALSGSAGARAYYDLQRARGLGHPAALRQLANRLVGILHGCLKTGSLYDETTAWGHHRTEPAPPAASAATAAA